MAPSGKGYPPPVPRVLRSKSGDGLPPPQPQPPQTQNQASNMLPGFSRNLSPTFPNLIPRSTPREIDPRPASGPASQPRLHQDMSRAGSRIRSRTGSLRPPPQNTSLPRPRDLIPRPRPRAIPHLIPRPRFTPMDRDLFLDQGESEIQTQVPEDQDQAETRAQTRAPEQLHFQGQGQFQIQLQAQAQPRIDPQIRVQNHEFYTNFPYPFPTEDSPFPQSQTTIAPGNQNLNQASHRDMHQPQFPTQVHSDLQNRDRDQNFYNNFPFPFPTPQNPFSNFQAGVTSRDRELHRDHHRDLVQARNETENETSTRASKRPRLSYSHAHPNDSRDEESNGDGNIYGNGNRDRDRDGAANEDRIATRNDRYHLNDTSSESPLSTPPDSVYTSPPLPPLPALRNFPRTGTFTSDQRFNRSPTSRIRARGGHGAENKNENVIASRTRTTNPLSSSNSSNSFTEPPALPSTLDIAHQPTAAQKKWMYAVRAEGRRKDRNENGGFSRGIEGQMVGGEGGV
ncbi:hypothetical protein BHYA_0258g00150 [Botrytis hyacinthi]|uniref:Uncharacterized protein n=1 Tax=Botrytis hyacinthi TaxID=278943 RepID=A0A4Z1GH53_9HELO|nr:hypothetical protein BHYA_0258g00150 [Botrytis hyacinthi]